MPNAPCPTLLRFTVIPVVLSAATYAQTSGAEALKKQYNYIYSAAEEQPSFNHGPNAFLVEMIKGLKPGAALDVGMGQGRNALWLAKHGWDVTGFDVSDVGVKLAQEQASQLGVHFRAVVQTMDEFDFGTGRWDLVVITYVPFESTVNRIYRSLKPGGLVLVENFHMDTRRVRLTGGGLADNELLKAFSDFRVLRYEDTWTKQDWGVQLGEKNRLVRLLAQKPGVDANTCSWQEKAYHAGEEACWAPIKIRCGLHGWERAGKCSE